MSIKARNKYNGEMKLFPTWEIAFQASEEGEISLDIQEREEAHRIDFRALLRVAMGNTLPFPPSPIIFVSNISRPSQIDIQSKYSGPGFALQRYLQD